MRIIAGKLRGRRLAGAPEGVRPTADRLRESLFSSLGEEVGNSTWLDLFAGTGSVGMEALSRGARKVVLNDRNPTAARAIRRNLETLGLDEGWELRELDAFAFLKSYPVSSPFDFVFLDPPYSFPHYTKLLSRLKTWPGISPSTVMILEVFKRNSLDFLHGGLVVIRKISAGDSIHLLLRLTMDDAAPKPFRDEHGD